MKRFFLPIIALLPLVLLGVLFKNNIDSKVCGNSISCIKDLKGWYEKDQTKGTFLEQAVAVPLWEPERIASTAVLGQSTAPKHIEVDLSSQRLYAFEGDKKVFEFPISSGKWYPTPTGTFNIWVKLRYTRMEGGNPGTGTYYNLPNVPYAMFYYNDEVPKSRGFSLHGAYWHNNFGHPMSHGCVNMRTEDVAKLYEWADPETNGNLTYAKDKEDGTKVIVYGTAPEE